MVAMGEVIAVPGAGLTTYDKPLPETMVVPAAIEPPEMTSPARNGPPLVIKSTPATEMVAPAAVTAGRSHAGNCPLGFSITQLGLTSKTSLAGVSPPLLFVPLNEQEVVLHRYSAFYDVHCAIIEQFGSVGPRLPRLPREPRLYGLSSSDGGVH